MIKRKRILRLSEINLKAFYLHFLSLVVVRLLVWGLSRQKIFSISISCKTGYSWLPLFSHGLGKCTGLGDKESAKLPKKTISLANGGGGGGTLIPLSKYV